jgi:hypothetical protein
LCDQTTLGKKIIYMQYEVSGYLKVGAAAVGIEKNRYQEIKNAKRTCIFALEVEEKCALLLDNFYEMECELLKLAEASVIWTDLTHETAMLGRLNLDRRIVNLLTASRLYLDQTDSGISRLFGNPSNELSILKQFKNALYDENWGYRLMESVRNYVQHSGLIVHIISHKQSQIDGKFHNYSEHMVLPQINPNILSESDKFKKTTLKELRHIGGGKPVDLRIPLREYISCLIKLHCKVRETLDQRLLKDLAVYKEAISEFSTIQGEAVSFPHLIEINDDSTFNEQIALVPDFLEYHKALRSKNSVNPNLASRCASNSIQEKA